MGAAVKKSPAFRHLIAGRRRGLRLSQETAAERIGVSTSYIARLELGARTPSDANVAKIAEAYGLDPIDVYYSLGRVAPDQRNKEDVRLALHRVREEEAAWAERDAT